MKLVTITLLVAILVVVMTTLLFIAQPAKAINCERPTLHTQPFDNRNIV